MQFLLLSIFSLWYRRAWFLIYKLILHPISIIIIIYLFIFDNVRNLYKVETYKSFKQITSPITVDFM